jgi:hypothetical protein
MRSRFLIHRMAHDSLHGNGWRVVVAGQPPRRTARKNPNQARLQEVARLLTVIVA